MANPILDAMMRNQNPMMGQNNMLSQFANFKQQMQGKNPEEMIRNLLDSGQMSPQQFQELKKKAIELQAILNKF